MLRAGVITLAACMLGACATFAPPPSPGGRAPEGSARPPAETPEAPPSARSRAAASLLEQSRAERSAGHYAAAAAAVERALSIEPNDPWLWLELGEIKLAEGDRGQAEGMARKALTLAAGDPAIERRAAELLN